MSVNNRISINLLPQDITDKRKGEQRLIYALIAAFCVGGLLFAIFAVNMIRISGRERVIRDLERENANYEVAISEIRSFQEKKTQMEQREKLIDSVSTFKFSWSKFLNDISLIIPNDVWLTKVNSDGMVVSFEGLAATVGDDNTDFGHKPVAKWLVHLGQISGLSDVWLTASERSSEKEDIGKVKFTTTAKIKQPESKSTTPPAVPAPPPSGTTGGN